MLNKHFVGLACKLIMLSYPFCQSNRFINKFSHIITKWMFSYMFLMLN